MAQSHHHFLKHNGRKWVIKVHPPERQFHPVGLPKKIVHIGRPQVTYLERVGNPGACLFRRDRFVRERTDRHTNLCIAEGVLGLQTLSRTGGWCLMSATCVQGRGREFMQRSGVERLLGKNRQDRGLKVRPLCQNI